MRSLVILFLTSLTQAVELKSLLAQTDQIVFEDDFTKSTPLDKTNWAKRQGTQ